ncbi:MAG: chemotaxis protein CheR [Magnetococcales bacterium]|nr:chemotaxis protein CheR [Magnetococcales bacterium]
MSTTCEETEAGILSDASFYYLQRVVQQKCGLYLEPRKKDLVLMRIKKRLSITHADELRAWCDLVTRPGNDIGLQDLIDEVTTQHTKFFRENAQLDHFQQWILPAIQQRGRASAEKKIRVWSAGCSSGEEPYTLAMILLESLGEEWDIRILASDICHKALDKAASGLYLEEQTAHIPPNLLDKYFEPVAIGVARGFRARTLLRERIDFRKINFMDARYPINTAFEIIFCRNVIIYFDQASREQLLARFASHLQPDNGYLFLGHSELVAEIPSLQKHKFNIFQKTAS